MHDGVTGGLLAGAGDGVHIILVGILVLMVLGMMGHSWFWTIIVPVAPSLAGGITTPSSVSFLMHPLAAYLKLRDIRLSGRGMKELLHW